MNNLTSLTYETLLAYVLPASIVEILFLPLLSDSLNIKWNIDSAGYLVLGFIGLSIGAGLLFNMWGTVITTELFKYQQRKRNLILFGKPKQPTVLVKHLETLYPDVKEQDDKIEIVYAIFNSHVSEHIYARRNWDWSFYQSSRNILATSPFSIVALVLLAFRDAWSISLSISVLVATITILVVIYFFMLRQLEIYYGFYANVVLGHLLVYSAQTPAKNQSSIHVEEEIGEN